MNYNYNKNINLDGANKAVTQLLKSYFNPKTNQQNPAVLINDPVFLVSHTAVALQLTVQLSYYQGLKAVAGKSKNSNLTMGHKSSKTPTLLTDQISALTNALTRVYESAVGGPVNVQLELVRQHQPYMDASILAQYLAINASKHGFNRMMNLLLGAVPYLNPDYTFNLSCITGVKVQLSGLLTSQRNRTRKSVYTASAGTLSQSPNNISAGAKANGGLVANKNTSLAPLSIGGGAMEQGSLRLDYATQTAKSRLGAFTVKVWIASTS